MAIQYARPSDNKSPSATWTVTSGALAAAYPIANISDLIAAKPIKATGTSLTVRATFGGSQQIKAIVIVGHNLVGATVALTNNGGMASQTIAIPANHEDGHSVNPFKDLSAVASNSGTQWDLAITGAAANVAIGEVLLLSEWRTFERNIKWGLRDRDIHPTTQHRTDGRVRHVYDHGIKIRRLSGEVDATDAGYASLLALARDARGSVKNWPLVLDPLVNDARFLHFADDEIEATLQFLDLDPIPLAFEEESRGLPL
jgi:hypothetical protein